MNSDIERAFLQLVEANRNLIYKVCLMFTEDDDNLADRYQDIVMNLWISYPKFRNESKPSTWIYRIAFNTCVSEVRRQQARPTTMPLTCELDELTGDDNGYAEQIHELYRLINSLSKIDRAIILLWLDDKSYDEIAEVIGMSKSNIGVRLMRIKEKLRKMSNN